MNLRNVAAKFETISFDAFNEATQLWEPDAFIGKVMPVDRFLSIFNRPTRRRSIGLSPDITLPVSRTIRNPNTGLIYVVGEVRKDSFKGVAYDSVGILHTCDVTGVVTRKAPVGPISNPGGYQTTTIATSYMDMELRAASEPDESVQNFEGNFFLTTHAGVDLKAWDFISYSGDNYQVETVYFDSGLLMARVVKRDDIRVDVTYNRRTNTAGYDASTGVVTSGIAGYIVTGFFRQFKLSEVDGEAIKAGDLIFTADLTAFGFEPATGDEIVDGSKTYRIGTVRRDFIKRQYNLQCRV